MSSASDLSIERTIWLLICGMCTVEVLEKLSYIIFVYILKVGLDWLELVGLGRISKVVLL